MRLSSLALFLSVGVSVLALTAPAMAQQGDVGKVAKVGRAVYGTPPGAAQEIKRQNDAVVFKEMLETRRDSSALIRFLDGSELAMGEASAVTIDQYVFDPGQNQGNAVIDLSVGSFRFATGDMPKGGVTIETPTSTLILRGTVVRVRVKPNGNTSFWVDEGTVDASAKGSSNTAPSSFPEGTAGQTSAAGLDQAAPDPSGGVSGSRDPAGDSGKGHSRGGEDDRGSSSSSSSNSSSSGSSGGYP